MDPLDLTQDKLLTFFHYNKTEMSCMDRPLLFLYQLRDNHLLSEELFTKVSSMETKDDKIIGVYEVLDTLERKNPERVKTFWECVFKDHIMQRYPTLRSLRDKLTSDVSLSEKMDNMGKRKDAEGENEELKEKKVELGCQEKQNSKTSKRKGGEVTQEDEDEATQAIPSIKKKKQQTSTNCSPLTQEGREDIWNLPKYKTQLPVTCGDKEGILHKDKLANSRGEQCIVHQDRWYTPSEFEKLGGKERMKKWKTSIYCGNTPLQKLIEERILKCPPAVKRTSNSGQRRSVRLSSRLRTYTKMFDDTSSEEESSSSSQEENNSEGDQIDEGEEETMMAEAEGAVKGDSYHDKDVDPSMFKGSSLPVQCGSVTATLRKDRFASGNTGRCIRTEDSWLTPEEFVRLNPDLTDGMWKTHITCRGQPLSFLLQRKILYRKVLTESDLENQSHDDDCFICGFGGKLLCCDACPRSFHADCHLPACTPPEGDWLCTFCVWKKTQESGCADHMTQRQVLDSSISKYKLQCQYLLLVLLNADEQRIFTKDPRKSVSGYSSVGTRPMWLQKVRENLESRYTLVGEFVSDIRLIFRNCAMFNRNNPELRNMGNQLGTLFEEQFQKTFNITFSTSREEEREEVD